MKEIARPTLGGSLRCRRCRCDPRVCICGVLPCLHLPYDLVFYSHPLEYWRQSNTARLASLSIAGAPLFISTDRIDEVALHETLEQLTWAYLVFPETASVSIEQVRRDPRWDSGKKPTFVMIDGSWRQARKMTRRLAARYPFPSLVVPPGQGLESRMRQQKDPSRMCTAEAVVSLIASLDLTDNHPERQLMGALEVHVRMQLALRGIRTPVNSPESM